LEPGRLCAFASLREKTSNEFWDAFMSRRTLTILITILLVLLALTFVSSERGVAGVLEWIGAMISKLFD
jgi:hypothetical protein